MMSTRDILEELPRLSVEDREQIAKALRDLRKEEPSQPPPVPDEPRTPNLHPGAMIMAPDFDDPLPDEFWFGKDT